MDYSKMSKMFSESINTCLRCLLQSIVSEPPLCGVLVYAMRSTVYSGCFIGICLKWCLKWWFWKINFNRVLLFCCFSYTEPLTAIRTSYLSLLFRIYWSDYNHSLTSNVTSFFHFHPQAQTTQQKTKPQKLFCYKAEWNGVTLTNPVLFMCHEHSAVQKWHLGAWLWMVMWQVAMLLSHWDQISQVSGAFGTLEASLVHWPPTHPSSTPYSPIPIPSQWQE